MLEKLLPANQHPVERFLRIALGFAIMSLSFIGPQTAWAYLGLIPLLTGVVGSCPLYTMFGFSTCKPQARRLIPGPAVRRS